MLLQLAVLRNISSEVTIDGTAVVVTVLFGHESWLSREFECH